ncbi:MAG: hypothetical protein QOE97_1812 [Pseudonocardiales bacterium]|jgi:mycofactocin precursor|nr:hypothetical protein [Pseudonocardiales bacterium]
MSDAIEAVETVSPETVEAGQTEQAGADEVIVADVLVEEVSIDGMCGVY